MFENWLPFAFMVLLGVAILVYVILDGYDLGVGMLMAHSNDDEKDTIVASIGPFWDANETWLVLAIGILLVAFPPAYGLILTSLYIPVAIMLFALILRGVSFDFRAKAQDSHKKTWNFTFMTGSLIASFSQGYMLGAYIMGFNSSLKAIIFNLICGVFLCFGYRLVGACWLIWKTEGDLQKKAVKWAKASLYFTVLGMAIISIVTPLTSQRIFAKWFSFPNVFYLSIMPLLAGIIAFAMLFILKKLPMEKDRFSWLPFALVVGLFVICFQGIAYSFFPFVVPEKLLIVESASAKESLLVIFIGAVVVVPIILAYTFFTYYIFRGKTTELKYY